MAHKIISFSLLLLGMAVLSCNKQNKALANPEWEKIYGKWEWVNSSGGWGGETISPQTEGYTQSVELSTSDYFSLYKNGQLQEQKKFKLSEGKSIFSVEKGNLITIKGKPLQSFEMVGQDTLILREECYDCYMHVFERK